MSRVRQVGGDGGVPNPSRIANDSVFVVEREIVGEMKVLDHSRTAVLIAAIELQHAPALYRGVVIDDDVLRVHRQS